MKPSMQLSENLSPDFSSIDWDHWSPKERATLCFVVVDGQVLLIRKKRGLGAGKINGPGGRVDPGESFRDCAIRECREELCIEVQNPKPRGRLRFQFQEGYRLECHLFVATGYSGTAEETDEAIPLWTDCKDLPFSEMWADDILWLQEILDGQTVDGCFLFDDDTMLGHRVLYPDA